MEACVERIFIDYARSEHVIKKAQGWRKRLTREALWNRREPCVVHVRYPLIPELMTIIANYAAIHISGLRTESITCLSLIEEVIISDFPNLEWLELHYRPTPKFWTALSQISLRVLISRFTIGSLPRTDRLEWIYAPRVTFWPRIPDTETRYAGRTVPAPVPVPCLQGLVLYKHFSSAICLVDLPVTLEIFHMPIALDWFEESKYPNLRDFSLPKSYSDGMRRFLERVH